MMEAKITASLSDIPNSEALFEQLRVRRPF